MRSPFSDTIVSGPGQWNVETVLFRDPGVQALKRPDFMLLESGATCKKSRPASWRDRPHGEALGDDKALGANRPTEER